MKDTYFFSHDANALTDTKILNMRADYGLEGYGLFWAIIEQLRCEENYSLPRNKNTYRAIKMNTNTSIDVGDYIDDCIGEYGLFEASEDGMSFYSNSLKRRMAIKDEKKMRRSVAGKKGAEKRWNESNNSTEDSNAIKNNNNAIKEDSNAITKPSEKMANDSKGKESKVKESKRKEEEIKKEEKPATAASNWITEYESNIGLITPMVIEEVESYELSDEVVIEAIKEAVRSGVRMPKYICRILEDFKANNIKTRADVEARRIERSSRLHNKDKPTSAYVNPVQIQNEYGDLDRFYANRD